MQVYNLPDDIPILQNQLHDDVIIYDYEAKAGAFKDRSILHKNAISLVIKGEKTMHFAEQTVHINDGEIHLLSVGNCLASMKITQEMIRSVLVFFDSRVLENFFLKYDKKIRELRARFKTYSAPYLSFRKDEFISQYIQTLVLQLNGGTIMSLEMRHLKFEELMLYLIEKYPQEILSFKSDKKNSFDDLEVRRIVENNVTNFMGVDELAFLCNVSVSTFKRRFVSIYGLPPGKWILHRRMEIAANLLLHHNENPSIIFSKVGYENHSSFSQSFKSIYGVTPKEYKNQNMIV